MKRLPITMILALVMLSLVSGVYAGPQAAHRATLSGVVLGPGGKPVANAVVTYQSGGGDTPHAARTDAHGRFSIPKLRRDNYDLRASAHGMFSNWEKNVMLRSGEQKSITLRLTSGADVSKTAMKPPQP
jgi:Carboxypeptidase regulatory-like domain